MILSVAALQLRPGRHRSRVTSPRGNALPEAERAPYRTHFEYNEVDELRPPRPRQSMQVTASDYWNGGELRSRRTERAQSPNDTVERWYRFSDGRLARLDRKRQGAGEFAKHQNYDYDLIVLW